MPSTRKSRNKAQSFTSKKEDSPREDPLKSPNDQAAEEVKKSSTSRSTRRTANQRVRASRTNVTSTTRKNQKTSKNGSNSEDSSSDFERHPDLAKADEDWVIGWKKWIEYRSIQNSSKVPRGWKDSALVEWVNQQQKDHAKWKRGKPTFLSNEGFELMSNMGFHWSDREEKDFVSSKGKSKVDAPSGDDEWNEQLEAFKSFCLKKRRSRKKISPPSDLEAWIATQKGELEKKNQKKSSSLTASQIESLTDAEFQEYVAIEESLMEEPALKDEPQKKTSKTSDRKRKSPDEPKGKKGNGEVKSDGNQTKRSKIIDSEVENKDTNEISKRTIDAIEEAIASGPVRKSRRSRGAPVPFSEESFPSAFDVARQTREVLGLPPPIGGRKLKKSDVKEAQETSVAQLVDEESDQELQQDNEEHESESEIESETDCDIDSSDDEEPSAPFGPEFWDWNYKQLKKYKKRVGHTCVPKSYPENQRLSTWVYQQRKLMRQRDRGEPTSLTDEKLRRLKRIGFVFNTRHNQDFWYHRADTYLSSRWDETYERLVKYKEEHGNCLIPKIYPPDQGLAYWVARQRKQHRLMRLGKLNLLSETRIKKLRDIGFIFNTKTSEIRRYCVMKRYEDMWEASFKVLTKFKEENGHCMVPRRYPQNQTLAAWTQRQRAQYNRFYLLGKSSCLNEERVRRLKELGFVFRVARHLYTPQETKVEDVEDSEDIKTEAPMEGNEDSNDSSVKPAAKGRKAPPKKLQPKKSNHKDQIIKDEGSSIHEDANEKIQTRKTRYSSKSTATNRKAQSSKSSHEDAADKNITKIVEPERKMPVRRSTRRNNDARKSVESEEPEGKRLLRKSSESKEQTRMTPRKAMRNKEPPESKGAEIEEQRRMAPRKVMQNKETERKTPQRRSRRHMDAGVKTAHIEVGVSHVEVQIDQAQPEDASAMKHSAEMTPPADSLVKKKTKPEKETPEAKSTKSAEMEEEKEEDRSLKEDSSDLKGVQTKTTPTRRSTRLTDSQPKPQSQLMATRKSPRGGKIKEAGVLPQAVPVAETKPSTRSQRQPPTGSKTNEVAETPLKADHTVETKRSTRSQRQPTGTGEVTDPVVENKRTTRRQRQSPRVVASKRGAGPPLQEEPVVEKKRVKPDQSQFPSAVASKVAAEPSLQADPFVKPATKNKAKSPSMVEPERATESPPQADPVEDKPATKNQGQPPSAVESPPQTDPVVQNKSATKNQHHPQSVVASEKAGESPPRAYPVVENKPATNNPSQSPSLEESKIAAESPPQADPVVEDKPETKNQSQSLSVVVSNIAAEPSLQVDPVVENKPETKNQSQSLSVVASKIAAESPLQVDPVVEDKPETKNQSQPPSVVTSERSSESPQADPVVERKRTNTERNSETAVVPRSTQPPSTPSGTKKDAVQRVKSPTPEKAPTDRIRAVPVAPPPTGAGEIRHALITGGLKLKTKKTPEKQAKKKPVRAKKKKAPKASGAAKKVQHNPELKPADVMPTNTRRWGCEFCSRQDFDTFVAAAAHEATCSGFMQTVASYL